MPLFRPRRSSKRVALSQQHPFSELPLILASGLGRSGTTVLRHCIGIHSKIAFTNEECNYIHDLMRSANSNLDYKNRLKALAVTTGSYWQLHHQLLLNLFWPADRWDSSKDYRALSTYSMLDPRASTGLKKTFAKLAVCYIIRNGIEVVSSYVSFPEFKHLDFKAVCKLWAFRQDMVDYQAHCPHFFLFRYEWFQQPDVFQKQLTAAFKSVGLDFEPDCLQPLTTKFHPTVFAGEPSESAGDLSRRRDRWKYWDDQQRDEFVNTCGPAMQAQGYEIPWI